MLTQTVFSFPLANGAWLSQETSCGLPGAVASIQNDTSFIIYSILMLTFLQSGILQPAGGATASTAVLTMAVIMLHAVCYMCTIRCMELELGTVISPLATYLMAAATAAIGVWCAEARVQSEMRQMLGYFSSLPVSRKDVPVERAPDSMQTPSHIEGPQYLCLTWETVRCHSSRPACRPPRAPAFYI